MTEKDAIYMVIIGAQALLNLYTLARRASGRGEARDVSGGDGKPLTVQPAARWAAAEHGHPDLDDRYALRLHSHECREHTQRLARLEQDSAGLAQEMRAGLSKIVDTIAVNYRELNEAAERRANDAHTRMNPIAEALAAETRRLNDHLEDHRAGKA